MLAEQRLKSALGIACLSLLAATACGSAESPAPPSPAVESEAGDGGGGEKGPDPDGGEGGSLPLSSSTAGAAGEDSDVDPASVVHGMVLDAASKRGLAQRVVAIGSQRTLTDDAGKFVLRGVPARYDAQIVEPDGTCVSVYRGVSRRDPTFVQQHTAAGDTLPRSARVQGVLSGGSAYPLDPGSVVAVQFLSAGAEDRALFDHDSLLPGPDFSLFLAWNGARDLPGKLVARGTFQPAVGTPAEHWFASAELSLRDGRTAVADLALHPVASQVLTGSLAAPSGVQLTRLQEYFRFPFPASVLGIASYESPDARFTHEVDDLASEGLSLCAAAFGEAGQAQLQVKRCGLVAGDNADLELAAAPQLELPGSEQPVTASTHFAWSPFPGGIHLLAFETLPASREAPNVYVYTDDTSSAWPDVVDFPRGTDYECTVSGLGPFDSLDAAVGPAGLGEIAPALAQRSRSAALDFIGE